MKLLMHMCCGPCAVYPLRALKEKNIQVDGLYYNPNIHPIEEFAKREENVEKLSKIMNIKVHYLADFKQETWEDMATNERKCNICYDMRLKRTFEFALANNYDAVTTSLLVSPYQDHELIMKTAKKYAKLYSVGFYYEDFRKGYRKGQKKAKDLGIYCQRYCGCIISLRERIKEISQVFKNDRKPAAE